MKTTDELNNITTEFDAQEYFREYFKPMDIPEESKKEREEAANDIFELLLFMFLLIEENQSRNAFNYQDILIEFQRRYADVIAEYGRNDAYFQSYLATAPRNILDTTLNNNGSEYYLSNERAAIVGANEANSILNYEDLQKKIDAGYTHKTWVAEIDRYTRMDHLEMDGTTIPIEEYFEFPDCEMMMPHDEVNGTAKQCANCRCSLKYKIKTDEEKESEYSNKGKNKNTKYDRDSYSDSSIRKKVDALGENESTGHELFNRVKETIIHRDGTNYEDLSFIDTQKGKSLINKDYDFYDPEKGISACKPNKPMIEMIKNADDYTVIGIHNHPRSTVPSIDDLSRAYERKYKFGLAFGHNGTWFKYTVGKEFDADLAKLELDILSKVVYTTNEVKIAQSLENLKDCDVIMEIIR